MTRAREELKGICRAILREAERRIDDPKNVKKGDGWATHSWREMREQIDQETNELEDALEEAHKHDPLHEAADILVLTAQMIDKRATELL